MVAAPSVRQWMVGKAATVRSWLVAGAVDYFDAPLLSGCVMHKAYQHSQHGAKSPHPLFANPYSPLCGARHRLDASLLFARSHERSPSACCNFLPCSSSNALSAWRIRQHVAHTRRAVFFGAASGRQLPLTPATGGRRPGSPCGSPRPRGEAARAFRSSFDRPKL